MVVIEKDGKKINLCLKVINGNVKLESNVTGSRNKFTELTIYICPKESHCHCLSNGLLDINEAEVF